MDELLKKLLEAEILSEDSKKELEEAFQTRLDETIKTVEKETAERVQVELSEKWVVERDMLIEAIDSKIDDMLLEELNELKADVERFRDLETEYANKLVEAKKDLTHQLESDLGELVEKLDTFLEMRIAAEFDEIKEDLQEARKLEFGKKIFEAFLPEYRKYFVDATATEKELAEAKERIEKLEGKYKNVKKEKEDLFRKVKLEKVLSPLSGRNREIMETILNSVATDELEEGYKRFIGRVLKETAQQESSDENTLNESVESHEVDLSNTIIKEGNRSFGSEMLTENKSDSNSLAMQFKRMAGII